MSKPVTPAVLLLSALAVVSSAGAAWAQAFPAPDPAFERFKTQSLVNQTLLQTQTNTQQVQSSLQQNDLRQQQLFNSMGPPAYQPPSVMPKMNVPPPINSSSNSQR